MNVETKSLIFTDAVHEATICARCGYCNGVCCTYRELGWESTSPRGWLAMLRALSRDGKIPERLPDDFVQRLYNCTLCGKCGQVCPTHIDLRRLWLELRQEAVERGQGPDFVGRMSEVVAREHNVFDMPNQERAEWVEFMADAPADGYQKDRAEVLYYVGCVSSFSAAAQGIPKALAKVLELAGADFSILGGEEWCCGFPLIAAGQRKEADVLIAHNVERLEDLGAKTVVFNCPSCFHAWKHEYHLEGVELLHETQFLARLIADGNLKLGDVAVRATYHDPCDLGRNSGVYEEPRQVLRSVPGLEFVELLHDRTEAPCCGGGGDFEMMEPALTQRIATHLIEEAHRAGAERLVVACPQCKRTSMSGAESLGSSLKIVDIAELVLEAVRA
ncbi:MAG: (Fe-S)-binding protein [Chloroflexi bacterium]|nr:(Fe-S)-binding protein [Chloroflexota bacterium]